MLNYMTNTFSHTYAQNNVVDEAKHFNLDGHFTKYALSPFRTTRKLTALAFNISKYNSVVVEANKKKKTQKNPPRPGQEVRGVHPDQCLQQAG